MIIMVAKVKRAQVGPVGPEKRLSGVLTVEVEEVNGQTGLVRDQLHTFYPPAEEPGLKGLGSGETVELEVRPWAKDRAVHYEFVRFLGKSGKA